LIIIQTRYSLERLPGARAPPIRLQGGLMGECLLLDKPRRSRRQVPINHLAGCNRDIRFMLAIDSLKMRRRVIQEIHPDRDAIEPSDCRHRDRLNYPKSSAASCSGSDA